MFHEGKSLLVGIDGGGTGCRAVVGTRQRGVLARAEGGAANAATDINSAVENIRATVNAAAVIAGFSLDQLKQANAHLGLAGAIGDEVKARISSSLPYAHSVVTDDRPTTVTGALDGQDGHVVSVGTGTIIAASVCQSFQYVGGWGFHVADQASGAWLGRAALEHVLLCHDGLRDHSMLSRELFAQFKNDPNAVVDFSMSAAPKDFGSLAPTVLSGARADDKWAQKTLQAGADYLTSGLKQLGFSAGAPLCLLGGLGRFYTDYMAPEDLAGLIEAKGTALDGAFALALNAQPIVVR